MKQIKIIILKHFLLTLIFISTTFYSKAIDNDKITVFFKVTGNCIMCKKTIEKSLKNIKGVASGIWNQKSKVITVIYNPDYINEEKLHKLIASSGYDTEKIKAPDEAYNSLHHCCKYKRTMHK